MKPLIIDVREPFEYKMGYVAEALSLPPQALMAGAKELENIAKDAPLILYCKSGSHSNASINILRQMGYTNLTNGINKQQVEAKYGL